MEKVKISKDNFKRKAQDYCRTLEELTGVVNQKVVNISFFSNIKIYVL